MKRALLYRCGCECGCHKVKYKLGTGIRVASRKVNEKVTKVCMHDVGTS